jgi:sigma-B regulation protein RsbU (phosphoserine phosphatase)
MRVRNSLTFKLSFIILSVVLFIFTAIVIFNFKVTQKLLVEDAKKNAQYITRLTISQISDELGIVEEPVKLFSRYLSENKAGPGQLKRIVDLIAVNSDKISGSFIYDFHHSGDSTDITYYYRYYYNNKTNKKKNISNKQLSSWIQKLKITRKPFWSEPEYDSIIGELTSTYIVPLFDTADSDKKMSGLIAIDLRLLWLKESLQKNKVYNSDYIFIISKNGKPVVLPGNRFDYGSTIFQLAKKINNPEIYELGKKMSSGESGFAELPDFIQGKSSLIYYEPILSTNWSVGVVFPKAELLQKLYTTTIILGSVGLLGFLLILIFIILIMRRETKPLRTLSAAAKEIGKGNFDAPMPDIHTKDEVGILKDSLQTMQEELVTYIKNLVKATKEKERIEGELQIAQEIQMGYLRRDFSDFSSGLNLDISALLKPAKEVGGDYYDYFKISEDEIGFAIGDVAGKGVPAALFMTVALTLIRSGNYNSLSLANIVSKINNVLYKQNDNSFFITAFFGVLNLSSGEVTFCNAGHNYPYLLKNNDIFEIQATHGPALGVLENQKYKTGRLKLEQDDMIVLYTDGVTDAENKQKEFYNKERFEEVLRNHTEKSTDKLLHVIYQSIRRFTHGEPQSDDITLMAIKFTFAGKPVTDKQPASH